MWFVPSIFGGGEAWWRQATPYEMRAVSYAAVVHGATGLQYFVRSEPNVHPSSVRLWNEVRAVAMELTVLTPWLLSHETSPQITFYSDNNSVHVRAWLRRGSLVFLAVNMLNEPTMLHLVIPAGFAQTELMWHGRTLNCSGTPSQHLLCHDVLDGFATRVYRSHRSALSTPAQSVVEPSLVMNGGFESSHVIGVPDYFFVNGGGSTPHETSSEAAFMMLDARTAHSGDWSLRLVSPAANGGLVLTAFPVELSPNRSYVASVWANAGADGLVLTFGAPFAGWKTPWHSFQLGASG
eukprot:COSAG05_NODE_5869_length_1069_cov_1.519588_1_plen_293_part_10